MKSRTLTTSEQSALLAHITSESHRAMIGLALFAGLRLNECTGLDVLDIAPAGTSRTVRHQFTIRAEIAKRGRSRTAYVNNQLAQLLADHLAHRVHQYSHAPGPAPLFISNRHRRLSNRQAERILTGYLTELDISGVTFHGLRHTFAHRVQRSNGDIEITRQLLGHSSIATTQFYINQRSSDELAAAV